MFQVILPVTVEHTSIFKCAISRDLVIITGLRMGCGCGMPEATKWDAYREGAGAQVPPLSQASSKAGLHLSRLSTAPGQRASGGQGKKKISLLIAQIEGLGQAYVKRI